MVKASASTGDDNSGVLSCWKTSCDMLKDVATCNVFATPWQLGRQSPRQSWSWSELRVKSSAFWYLSLIGLKSCNPGCGLVHSWTLDHSSCWITDTLHCCQTGPWCTLMLEVFGFKLSSSELCLLEVELAAWCHSIETSLAIRKGGNNGNDDVWFGMANRCKWSLICETYKKNDA